MSVLPRTEAALEAALNNELKGLPHDTIAFVATGRERSDPPPELLTRLRHGHPNLKPASEARYPKAGERASPGRYRGVEDRVTGERASVYSATVIGWESARKVRVNVSRFGGPLDASGNAERLELRPDGTWDIEPIGMKWVS